MSDARPSALATTFGPPLASPADYHKLARALKATPRHDGKPVKVAVLSSFTFNVVEPFLRVECARLGVTAEFFWGGFGEFENQVMPADSPLYHFAPDVLVLAMRPEDVSPTQAVRSWHDGGKSITEFTRGFGERVYRIASQYRERSSAPVLIATVAVPTIGITGAGDAMQRFSPARVYSQLNDALRAVTESITGTLLWDYAGLAASHGTAGWTDPRLWYTARMPVASRHHGALAQHLARSIRAAVLPPAKVLVLDLDNTVWGGVIGDDGIDGIKLGDEWPGSLFKDVQRIALSLRDRGILLAVLSKNDEPVARSAITDHPEMLFRWDDLAATSIAWTEKSRGMRAIAEELNLGVDALVLLDDNPVERAEVAMNVPTAKVIDVDAYPSIVEALTACPWFDQYAVSSEDLRRAELYVTERARRELAREHVDIHEFLHALEMRMRAVPLEAVDRQRTAQLFGKTNQFNLTQRRYSEADLDRIRESGDGCTVTARLSDKFGDHGLISAAVLLREEKVARIDSLVMSCRVMNRQVERGVLAMLSEVAMAWECEQLVGEFIASGRNGMVKDFYRANGFTMMGDDDSRWRLDLSTSAIAWPVVINRDA